MGKVRVTFSESAMGDLEDILDWYQQEQVPNIGRRLVDEILNLTEVLCDHPELGRVVPEFDQQHLRELIHPPFRVVYRTGTNKVQVVRVWRSERLLRLPQVADYNSET